MTQSAQPGTTSASEPADRLPVKVGAAGKMASTAWVAVSERHGLFLDYLALLRPDLALLALPPVVCALASLYAQQVDLQWAPVFFTLLSSVLALMGIGVLPASHRLGGVKGWVSVWKPLRGATDTPVTAHARDAARLGCALLALAVLSAAPVAMIYVVAAKLLIGLGIAVLALYGFDPVRRLIAPLDEVIAALCLGPGLVALTEAAQGHPMSGLDWLIAAAFGCMALAVIEGRRLRSLDAAKAQGRRTLVQLLGQRGTVRVAGLALAGGFALAVVISVAKPGGLPGALLALTALPLSFVGLSGLAVSSYPPARRTAAAQLARVYGWFGLALATGIALSVVAQGFLNAIVRTLGG